MRTALIVVAFFVLFTVSAHGFEGGDTGAYRILEYRVKLTPHTDGTVAIDYYQKWSVTDGHIPWITVGMPNDDYEITGNSMAATSAYANNGWGESLAHIDLDKDYQAGETFEIRLSIMERRFFYAEGGLYKLNFSPGWYDRAAIDSLQVRVAPPGGTSSVTTDPSPTSKSDQEMLWTRTALTPGQRFSISLAFPKSALAIADTSLMQPGSTGQYDEPINAGFVAAFVFVIIAVVVYALSVIRLKNSGGYTGGNICSSGAGGVRRGCACVACACACAGCACACACAGGGGAGCSRKMIHTSERIVK